MTAKDFFRHQPLKTTLLCLMALASSLLLVGSSYAMTWEFNALKNRQLSLFLQAILLQFACLGLSALLTYLGNLSLERLIQDYLLIVRQEISDHLFLDGQEHSVSQAQNQLFKEEDLLATNYLHNLYNALAAGFTALAAGGALLSFHWSLFLASLAFALIQLYLPKLLSHQLNQAINQLSEQNQAYLKTLGDWLNGINDLHRGLALAWFKEKITTAGSKLEEANVHKAAVTSRLDYLNQFAYSLGNSLLLLLTTYLVLHHWAVFGLLSSIVAFNSDFFSNLQNFANYYGEAAGTKDLRQELAAQRQGLPESQRNGQAPAAFTASPLTIKLGKSCLSYPAISVTPGEKVLLTGESGRGKSTFFKILLGEVPIQMGKITYLDQTGQAIEPDLEKIGYLPQDPQLFPGTIMENMTMFNLNLAGPDLLAQTAQKVHLATDLKQWPKGLKTKLDLSQPNFSGGQRQKIVLARSYLYQSRLLLIDEGTSAIDEEATIKILHQLLKTDQTILFIAHSLTPKIRELFDREIHLA